MKDEEGRRVLSETCLEWETKGSGTCLVERRCGEASWPLKRIAAGGLRRARTMTYELYEAQRSSSHSQHILDQAHSIRCHSIAEVVQIDEIILFT